MWTDWSFFYTSHLHITKMKIKDIRGYEGRYGITEIGEVWSYKRNMWLKPIPSRGYLRVAFYEGSKQYKFLIHRLVWETYCGPVPEGMTIDHIDANKLNNNISNLQLLTRGDNASKANKGNTYWLGKKHSNHAKQKIGKASKERKHERDSSGRFREHKS